MLVWLMWGGDLVEIGGVVYDLVRLGIGWDLVGEVLRLYFSFFLDLEVLCEGWWVVCLVVCMIDFFFGFVGGGVGVIGILRIWLGGVCDF